MTRASMRVNIPPYFETDKKGGTDMGLKWGISQEFCAGKEKSSWLQLLFRE